MNEKKVPKKRFRTELEGLRAVAALLVAIYHIWLGNVSGGVDVFFVVSGFLITTSLLSRYERNNKIDFTGFILRLTKRLFPIGFTVLFTTTIACILWLPQIQWAQTVKEVFASALYFQNWQLASNSVDYLAQNNEASPFQHYWAMSIQGQFYIIWPLLLLTSIIIAKYIFKKSIRSVFLTTLLVVFCLSFTYSVYLTSVNQPWAYFDTFTRVWEFSLGGIVSLLISKIVIRKLLSVILGWTGLLALISCGVVLQVSTVFPGYAALWPTLSAIFILLAGNQGGSLGVHRLLSLKPLVKFGSISYAFYLWHWPVLIFYFILTDQESVSHIEGIGLMVFAAILSYLSTALVEKPIRERKSLDRKWKTAAVAIALMIPVLLVTTFWSGTIKKYDTELASAVQNKDYPGAAILVSGNAIETPTNEPVAPSPLLARNDLPESYIDGCHQQLGNAEVIECEYGNTTDDDVYTIALVGGSHSAHWLPALKELAISEKIKVISYTKSGCRFSTEKNVEDDCIQWNEELVDRILTKKPDLVFTTADVAGEPNVPAGFVEQWGKLNNKDISVFAVRDNPRFGFDVASCVEENGAESAECMKKREDVLPEKSAWSKLDHPPKNVHYSDLSDSFCKKDICKPVIGNVLIYRDNGHITATYSKTLAPILRKELMPILESGS